MLSPPDGGWGWVVCIASLVNSFLVDGTVNCFGVFLPEYMDHFNTSVGYTTLANGLQGAVYPMIGELFYHYLSQCHRLAGIKIASTLPSIPVSLLPHAQYVSKLYQNQMKLYQNCIKMLSKLYQNRKKIVSKLYQNRIKIVSTLYQNCIELVSA